MSALVHCDVCRSLEDCSYLCDECAARSRDQARADGAAEERERVAKECDEREAATRTWLDGNKPHPREDDCMANDVDGHILEGAIFRSFARWLRARGEAQDAIREHVKEGLADSAAGRVSSLGSFAQYAETPKDTWKTDTIRVPVCPLCGGIEGSGSPLGGHIGACVRAPKDDAKEKALAALAACLLELHCAASNEKELHEMALGEFAFGHRCVMCDENVDRKGEVRAQIREAIAALEGKPSKP